MDVFGHNEHEGDFHVYGSELTIYIESDDGTLEAISFDINLLEEGFGRLLDMLQKIRQAKNSTTPEAENPKITEEKHSIDRLYVFIGHGFNCILNWGAF